MQTLTKYRFWIAGIVAVVALIGIILIAWHAFHPLPETTEFKARYFTFTYPREYDAKEYAPGVVSVGHANGDALDPLLEVTRYQSDPDVATPGTFDAFMKRQAGALCGADGPTESIACTEVGVTPYTSTQGLSGQMLNLTLVRKNLKTGTTTQQAYGPLYVFNTTPPPTPDDPLRYSAIFIYPSLAAYLDNASTTALEQGVISSFVLTSGTTSTVK